MYVKAQHCLMLHKAFVHSQSSVCVCILGEEGVRLAGRARGCACESVTEMGSDGVFFSFLPTANDGDVQSCCFVDT